MDPAKWNSEKDHRDSIARNRNEWSTVMVFDNAIRGVFKK